MTKKIRPLVKVPGSKSQLNSWIIDHFPKNYQELSYIEPFVGGGNILLNKETCIEEIINDKDANLICIWQAVRDEGKKFLSKLKKIQYKEKIFNSYKNKNPKNYFESAVREFILRKMSKNGSKESYIAPLNSKVWNCILEDLEIILQKSKNIIIFNKNACDVIRCFGEKNSLIYCDPPHLDTTKNENELSTDDHIAIAEALNSSHGKVIISGYNSSLYRKLYGGWKMCKYPSPQGKTECLWINF